ALPLDPSSPRPPADAGTADSLTAPLVEEMARRWQQGERPLAEDFLARDPRLRQPSAALELIYEELCLRQQHGPGADPANSLHRSHERGADLDVLLGPPPLPGGARAPRSPAVGEVLGGFRLLAELGRGSQGVVFLAAQPHLADRPVVLKVTPR